jgi:hypothetical protein
MSRILLLAVLIPLASGCTGIRELLGSDDPKGTAVSVSPGLLKKRIPVGSTAVAASDGSTDGLVALGCSDPASYNFCFTVMDVDGVVLREWGDQPKITVPSGGHLVATSIAFYPPSDVVIAGHTSVSLGEPDGGGGDGFVARYSLQTGSRVWIRQFGMSTKGKNSNQKEEFNDIAVDSNGMIYVAGRTRSNFARSTYGNHDAILLLIDSKGLIRSEKQVGTGYDDDFQRVVVAADGSVVVAGHTCGSLGSETNAVNTADASYHPANPCPNENSIDLVFGSWRWDSASGTLSENFLQQLGRNTLPSGVGVKSDFVYGLAVSNAGDIYFTGGSNSRFARSDDSILAAETNGGQSDIYVGRLSPAGALQWIRSFGGSLGGTSKLDFGRSILVQENGASVDLLVCAETLGNFLEAHGGGTVYPALASNGKGDIVLLRLAETGTLTSSVHYGNSTLGKARGAGKEGCGRILRQGTSVLLLGTSSGPLFSSGSGGAFFARDQISKFTDLLRE